MYWSGEEEKKKIKEGRKNEARTREKKKRMTSGPASQPAGLSKASHSKIRLESKIC